MAGRVETRRFTSSVLRENRLDDPCEREVVVYLPPSYDEGGRYPTVLVLPGFGSTNRSLLASGLWQESLPELFDRLIREDDCPPAILVLPDAATRLGGSQFLDSPATGRYQTYLVDEVIPFVDATYRTIPSREARAVVGRSSGGFGALRLGMDRPEVVAVVGSHAGDAGFEVSLRPLIPRVTVALERAGGALAFVEQALRGEPASSDYDPLFFLACAQAYAPEARAPFPHAVLPFDPRTGELLPDVWERYLSHDPVRRVASSADALAQMQLVYVDAGLYDEYGLQLAARQLERQLAAARAPVQYDEFEGGHRGTGWRYRVSLPRLIGALARER